jgi:hypothetical protein
MKDILQYDARFERIVLGVFGKKWATEKYGSHGAIMTPFTVPRNRKPIQQE